MLIETDVLAAYLVTPKGEPSLLRQFVQRNVCYTTMMNALELFRAAASPEEHEAVLSMLYLVRVLGFNARIAAPIAAATKKIEEEKGVVLSNREAMILGIALHSKLGIVTTKYAERYEKIGLVPVFRSLPAEPTTVL